MVSLILIYPVLVSFVPRQTGPERESATCIPQDENADQAGRKEELEAARKKYEWDITVRND